MNVTIKDLPDRLHRKLKARASTHNRSLNGEVIDILQKAVESTPLDVNAILREVSQTRARIKDLPLTDELLREAKNQGRK